jgi:uncharacterized protein with HEPN domain
MKKTEEVRLRHMRDAAAKAVAFAEGCQRTDLDTNEMLSLAVVRLLEIVGEASKNLSQAMRDQSIQRFPGDRSPARATG